MTSPKRWLREFVARSKDALTQEEVLQRLEKIERGVELQYLEKPQAEADAARLSSLAQLLSALGPGNHLVFIGSVLVVRRARPDGSSDTYSKSLSQEQLMYLEKNPHLLQDDPKTILEALSGIGGPVGGEG